MARFEGNSDRFRGRTVVVTGASAGVGRATARQFAQAGAKIGLIARDARALEETQAEIQSVGGEASCHPADVADAKAVSTAAEAIEARLGPIDVWVNNAMVTVFSPVAELTPEEVRRVTDVTYLGYVHGTMAALHHMRPRDSGTIVQVGSALAYRAIPLQAPYCAAKHAVRAFTEALRSELIHDGCRIAVTEVHLPAVNTPQFDWARAHHGNRPRPLPPIFEPDEAAEAILHAAANPHRREYWLGRSTAGVVLANFLVPSFLDRYLAHRAVQAQSVEEPGYVHDRDNLYEPESGLHRSHGSFSPEAQSRAMVMSGDAVRAGAFLGAVTLSAVAGMALGALLARLNGARPSRMRSLSQRWLPRP